MVEMLTTFHHSIFLPSGIHRLDGNKLLVAARVMQGHCEGRLMTKAKLVRCLGIPETTVLRKLRELVAHGIIVRKGDQYLIAPERAAALPEDVIARYHELLWRAAPLFRSVLESKMEAKIAS